MDPIPLPAPYGGVNEQIPIIAVESPQCEELMNFNVTQEGVALRFGDSKYKSITATQPLRLFAYGDTKLFLLTVNAGTNKIDIYDVDAGTVSFSSAAASGAALFYGTYFNKYLFFFNPTSYNPGFYYDGAAFGNIGYTGAGLIASGGNTFKKRNYIIQAGEAAYWYSGIDAITGALTKVDLSSIVEQNCYLSAIASITISDNVASIIIQSFVFSNGEILFYSGSYPDASDWSLIGRGKLGQPLSFNSVIKYQSDSLLLCDTGVISLKDLFLKGSEAAASLTINTRIQKTWTALVQAIRTSLSIPVGPINAAGALGGVINGVFDPKTNRIIVSFPYYLDANNAVQTGSFYFVFDTLLQSWFFQRSFGCGSNSIFDIVTYKNKVITVSVGSSKIMVYEKEGSTGFTDRGAQDSSDVGYDYEIKSGAVKNGRAYVQKGEGLDVIIKSDLYSETNYYMIKDFGVLTTSAQKIPDQGSSLQKPFVNVGIEGSYIQYKISGTTSSGKTVGYQLYGVNFWIEQGDMPR